MTQKTFTLQRRIPVGPAYDLIVAGGGPAGCGAALAAARLGAKVLLIEGNGCLGGMGTSAMVAAWSHLANGRHSVIGGLMRELLEKMYARGFIAPTYDRSFWNTSYNRGLGFQAEGYKLILDETCAEAGVDVRFFTRVIDVHPGKEPGTLAGLVTHSIEGYTYLPAHTVIDATGDAVVAHLMGVPCREAGRDTPHIMPPTLVSAHSGINYEVFHRKKQQACVDQALADGFFSQPDRHVPGLFRSGKTTATLNAGHVFGMNALQTESLSEGMRRGRQLAWEYLEFFRRYVPGCERMEMVTTAAMMGVRESRRIVGEYELDADDYAARRTFPDQIAIYCKQTDIHVYAPTPEEYARYQKEFEEADVLAPGEYYGLPYGILVPRGSKNFWVAGRCVSSDLKVNGAIRDQPACLMMGEAAGTAAVLSLRNREPADALNTERLILQLRHNGGNLPQATLSPTMTRRPGPSSSS